MNQQALEARRKYMREWKRQNIEKVKGQQERFWTKKAQEMGIDSPEEAKRLYQNQWRSENKDKTKQYNQKFWDNLAKKQ